MRGADGRHLPVIGEGTLAEVLGVLAQVPELAHGRPAAHYRQRLDGRRALLLVARQADRPVGFKAGYALQAGIFYSWIGGVVPSARGQGIAQALMEAQQQWALAQGFSTIEVKSSAQFPAMLALLARNGYRLLGEEAGKLRFGKALHAG
ncbi:GNAT family N-acetyltransferase [Stenotrophomonas sp. 24(2023)]|uniref:GNAT family N-acetyltransferase n=1 Tax=Stenotrophomonas sp. 24(2023) TaxID=3068324 RepID=UPI0027DFD4D4|nr:GNAT family N-acetyltransferase [Stenotrophomonas sp. 24(2023)]WMJ68616.1 GNAT family N-acetyltransferase [Stenotrophomonas sp. 24(2023)]